MKNRSQVKLKTLELERQKVTKLLGDGVHSLEIAKQLDRDHRTIKRLVTNITENPQNKIWKAVQKHLTSRYASSEANYKQESITYITAYIRPQTIHIPRLIHPTYTIPQLA